MMHFLMMAKYRELLGRKKQLIWHVKNNNIIYCPS